MEEMMMSPVGEGSIQNGRSDSRAADTWSAGPMEETIPPTPHSTGPATFKPEFQFVVNEDAKQARKTVRKHVMREYRRRERWEQGGKKAAPRGKPTDGPVGQQKQGRRSLQTNVKSESPLPESASVGQASWSNNDGEERTEANGELSPVTLSANKRRRQSPEVEQSEALLTIKQDIDDEDVEFELPLTPNEYELPYRADPWAAVARSQVDPFSRINFDRSPGTQGLLHHFAWIMPSIMDEMVAGTNFHRIGWLFSCVAVHDPTPVHVIMGCTLAHIALLHGEKEPPLAIEHKSKALQLINARMNHPVEALSDATIGAVVNIAGYELVDSKPERFAMHMKGLFRLISERGGMSTLRDNPDLEDVIVRLDVLRAYIAISNPRYPSYSAVRELEPLAVNIPPSPTCWNPLGYAADDRKEVYQFCEDSLYLVHALEDFMLFIGSAATLKTKDLDLSMRKLVASASSQLLRRDTIGVSDASQLSRKCLRLAALIFVDLATQELFDSPFASGHFVQKLKSQLLGSTTPWARSLEMLVMVLIKHDRMALEKAWRAWYIADVVTLTMNLTVDTWQAAEEKMMGYIRQEAIEASTGPRSSLIWDMRAMAESFNEEWG